MLELTPDNFESTLKEGKTVIDFWAPWCGPCRMFAPIFEETAGEVEGVTFAKVNTQDQPDLAEQANIRSIPTLVFMKDGEEIGREVGALPKEALKKKIEELFSE